MPYRKEHILVFLAYISDVEPEVNSAKDIVESINRYHERLGIELDLRIWKDVPAEFANPQEQINRTLVDNCDVFIGLIWKKWGTPTGQSDCGFKEEFSIAEGRYNETSSPQIFLYAKRVNENDIKEEDEKEDYNKIKEFKNEIVNKHKGFLIQFETINEWNDLIRGRLTQYMIDKYLSISKITAELQSIQAIPSREQYEVIEKVKTPKEIQALINDLAAHKSNIEKISNIEDFKKIRLFLLSSAIFYDANLYEILGNHEIHLLYLHKIDIKPIGLEARLIFRTIMADRYNLKVGWFWLRNIGDKIIREYISNHLIKDVNKEVRYGAVNFLDKFWLKKYKHQLLTAINDNAEEITIKALEICAKRGDESYLKIINEYLSNPDKDIAKAAWTAKFAILSRTSPDAAINFLQDFGSNRGAFHLYLEQIKDKISHIKLKELINNNDASIKEFAYKQLLKNNLLNVDEIRELLDSPIIELKILAYSTLVGLGESFNVKDLTEKWPSEHRGLLALYTTEQIEEIIEKIYDGYKKDELLNEINWISINGHLAYLSYGLRYFDSFKDQLYKDLDTDFKRIKDRYVESLKLDLRRIIKENISKDPKLSNVSTSEIDSTVEIILENQMKESLVKIDELSKFIIKQFTSAALKILTLKGTKESLVYARRYTNSNDKDIQHLVVQIIAKYGDAEDVSTLIKIALDNYGSTRVEAVRCALKFSVFEKTVIKQFLESDKKEIIKTCLSYDLTAKSHTLTEDAKKLLMNRTDDIRLYALSYLATLSKRKQLIEILNSYLDGATYYYNIVCWLDRILFAPPKIRRIYKQELLSI
jgi:HEAT repeat protein